MLFPKRMILKMSAKLAVVAGLLCLDFAPSLYAGNIVIGNVQDSSSNNLPDVIVQVAGPENQTVTDDNGDFTLEIGKSTPVTIHFHKQGYISVVKDSMKSGARVCVKLQPVANDDGLVRCSEPVSMTHALTWLRSKDPEMLDSKVDEKKFIEMVNRYGMAEEKSVEFRIRLPEGDGEIKALFLISEHGVGKYLMESCSTWEFADQNSLALVGVLGDPVQRGIYPNSFLDGMLAKIGGQLNCSELATVPVLTFGHSNGTGFSAFYAASNPDRTVGWISYHSGGCWHLEFPGIESVPGLVMHGLKDKFFQGQEQTVDMLRSKRNAAVCMTMEPFVSHWPADREATYNFIYEFCEACLRIRMNDNGLKPVDIKSGWLGARYDNSKGGAQKLEVAPYADFKGEKNTANWLPDETFARIWQAYCSKDKSGSDKRKGL